jgi:subfamily B ATP-binding cassette protein HlyB/CyaB
LGRSLSRWLSLKNGTDGAYVAYANSNPSQPELVIAFYENLIAANPNAGFPDVVQAAKIAEIHDVIEELPKGYNTEIGEHGVGLSGGQKQRLAIARAILKRPRILIFDEATSSLDQATAEQFAQTVNQLKGRVTTLFIAHQVPKGLQVDEVVRLGERSAQMRMVEETRS